MAIVYDENGKYVDEKGMVKLDPTKFADWQIAEEAEKTLPSVNYFREKLGLLEDEIIPYGKTPKIDFIKVMNRLKDKPDGKFIEVTAVTPTPFGEGKSTVSLGLIEGLGYIGKNAGGALRQPSGGPTMNVKGTAAGGGNALLMPMTEFSLGLTGDINDIMNAHNHSQVVGVHNVVDVAGQTQGELGHRHQQGVTAAGCSTLNVHSGAAGRLTQSTTGVLADVAQTFNQTQRNGGLTFTEGSGGNSGDFNELAVGLILQTVHNLDEVNLGGLAVGDDFFLQQAQLLAEEVNRGQSLLCFFCDLPVSELGGVQLDDAFFVYVLAVFVKNDCHGNYLLVCSPKS